MPNRDKFSNSLENVVLIGGSTYPELTDKVGEYLKIRPDDTERRMFPDGEIYVDIKTPVSRRDVFVLQTFLKGANGYSLNDQVVEAEFLTDAALRSAARNITLITPYLPYSRQDRKNKAGEPISAANRISNLQNSGVDRICAMDLHASQAQGFFKGSFNNMKMHPYMQTYLKQLIGQKTTDYTIVAPDDGGVDRATKTSKALGTAMEYLPKSREKGNSSQLIRDDKNLNESKIYGKSCIIIDDIIDTAGTLVSAADILHKIGAKSIIALATHGLFSSPAVDRVQNSKISEIVVTNTVPQTEHKKQLGDKLKVIDISQAIAEYVLRVNLGGISTSSIPNNLTESGITLI